MRRRNYVLGITTITIAIVLFWGGKAMVGLSSLSSTPNGKGPAASTGAGKPLSTAGNANTIPAPPRAGAVPVSKAPWASLDTKFTNGEFSWLVANARSSPSSGSYSYALRALAECISIMARGSEQAQAAQLESSMRPEDPKKKARIKALGALFEPCSPLGTLEHLQALRAGLNQELPQSGDAYEAMLAEALGKLGDKQIPREERQRKLIELLSLDDPATVVALRGTLSAPGATFEGVPLPASDRGPYGLAWEMVLCTSYGLCGGANSRHRHYDCVLHADCSYMDTMQGVQYITPPIMGGRVSDYYSRLHGNIARRNYSAFGVP